VIATQAILLAEDDANDIQLMRRAFRKARLPNPLYVTRNGDETIEYLAGKGEYADRRRYPFPFLLLLDLKMPRKSGFEVLEWMRERPLLRDFPVIVLTSSNAEKDIQRAENLGAMLYLVKPGEFSDLVAMMVKLEEYWCALDKKTGDLAAVVTHWEAIH
jgi:CheY-like chemotaxis protein